MTRICAWCQTEMPSLGETIVTHGICDACANRMIGDTPISLQQYLEDLAIPVLVTESDLTASFANRAARERLGLPGVAGGRIGEVFTCIHARQPEGCGRTIHCSGCAIRRSIIAAADSGKPQVDVPATLKYGDGDNPGLACFRVTALKQGELVLLLFDRRE